jgi:hypothetical protein
MLASEGINPRAAQALAGHSTVTMTLNTYTGVAPEMLRDAVDRLDAAIRGAGAGQESIEAVSGETGVKTGVNRRSGG